MKLLTLTFILALSVSSFSFASDLGQDSVSTEGAICEQRVQSEKEVKELEKSKEEVEQTVIKS